VTTFIKPKLGSTTENISAVNKLIDNIVLGTKGEADGNGPDMILFSEAIFSRGNSDPNDREQTETGTIMAAMKAKAVQYSTYIVFNYYEKRDGNIYCTSVMLDRTGKIKGKYDKIFIGLNGENFLTRGSEDATNLRPIDTEFGKIGMLVCKDLDTTMLGYNALAKAPFNENVERNQAFKTLVNRGAQMVVGSSIGDYTADIADAAKTYTVWAAISGQDTKSANFVPWTADDYAKYALSAIFNPYGEQVAGTSTAGYASTIIALPK
jgi:predicted amidohydrolase